MTAQTAGLVRWGLLPASGIAARSFVPAIRASEQATAVGVASRTRSKAEEFANAHGLARSYGSYEELLADGDIEAVYVSLPNGLHVEWVLRALAAGKHVLCEKPMDGDPRSVARAFDAAMRAGRLLMEAFMYRHHPDTRKIADVVASGELGELRHVGAALSFTMPGTQNIRLRPELQGGALMDVGCYAISMLRILAGEPSLVCGIEQQGPTGVDLGFAAFLRFASGATGTFDCALNLPSRSSLEVVGAAGILRADWPFFRPFFPHLDPPMIEVRVGLESRKLPLVDDNPYLAQIDNFSRAIRGRGAPLLGRADAVAQATVIDALRRSARAQGAWVAIGR